MDKKWSWEGRFNLSPETRVYEIGVSGGRAFIVTGAFASRYDWFVMALDDVEEGMRGWVQVTRGGSLRPECRSSEHFLRGTEPQLVRAGYIMEKFPCLTKEEAVEIALVTLPFLTDIFDVDPDVLKASIKS